MIGTIIFTFIIRKIRQLVSAFLCDFDTIYVFKWPKVQIIGLVKNGSSIRIYYGFLYPLIKNFSKAPG